MIIGFAVKATVRSDLIPTLMLFLVVAGGERRTAGMKERSTRVPIYEIRTRLQSMA